jgi:hypothetical protein
MEFPIFFKRLLTPARFTVRVVTFTAEIMTLGIIDRGEGRVDLMRSDAEIGWIADRAIGLAGFEQPRPPIRRHVSRSKP